MASFLSIRETSGVTRIALASAAILVIFVTPTSATDFNYIGPIGVPVSWITPTNWSPFGSPGVTPPGPDANKVTLSTTLDATTTITMPGAGFDTRVAALEVDDGNFVLTGTGSPWEMFAFDNSVPNIGRLSVGHQGTASLRIDNGDLTVALLGDVGGTSIGNDSVLEIGPTAFASLGEVANFGKLDVRGAAFTFDIIQAGPSPNLVISAGGRLDVFGSLTSTGSGSSVVQGTAGNVAQLIIEETGLVGLVDAFGEVEASRLWVTELRAGGKVTTEELLGVVSWLGGTIHILADLDVDSHPAAISAPFGANLSVGATKLLEVEELRVGAVGAGALTLNGGDVVSMAGRVGTAGLPTGPASVAINSANSTWTVAETLTVGGLPAVQNASVAISNGGDLISQTAIVGPPGLRATITVDGSGSTFATRDSMYLGGNAFLGGGQGTLALTDGGSLGAGDAGAEQLIVHADFDVTMNQGFLAARNLSVLGSIAPAVGAPVSGSVSVAGETVVSNGGELRLAGAGSHLIAGGPVTVQIGATLAASVSGGSATHVTVQSSGATWNSSNLVNYELGGTASGLGKLRSLSLITGGTANIPAAIGFAPNATDGLTMAGGTLNANSFNAGGIGVAGRGTINAVYTGSGAIVPSGTLTIGSSASTSGFATTGNILNFGHTLILNDADAAELGPSTALGFGATPGTLIADNGLNLGAGETISGYGEVQTLNNAADRVQNNGAINGSSTTNRLTLTGYYTGIGSYSNVEFAGTLSPGASPASINGTNIKFANASELLMELGGTTPGVDHDKINDSGQIIFDGILRVSLINGFAPSLGQSFDLFDFASRTGGFDATILPQLAFGLTWDPSQLYSSGRITVVQRQFWEADFNDDGDVDGLDMTVNWTTGFGQFNEGGASKEDGDATGDGIVDGADFLVWQQQFGFTSVVPVTTGVPEPASLLIAVLALAGMGCIVRGR